jgi:hypothetical protein
VKRISPLDALAELRKSSAEKERMLLRARVESERRARADEEHARSRLTAASSEDQSARQAEKHRLEGTGITAAEGQQRLAWEQRQRRVQAELAERLDKAIESRRDATHQHELAQGAVVRAEAELSIVRGRIEQKVRAEKQRIEHAQQETHDEGSARRFLERNDA